MYNKTNLTLVVISYKIYQMFKLVNSITTRVRSSIYACTFELFRPVNKYEFLIKGKDRFRLTARIRNIVKSCALKLQF